MSSLVMPNNMNNVCVTSTKSMHPCNVCNKELDNEKALWLHMRTHGIHHYYSEYHPSYSDQRRKVVSTLPSRLQSTLKDGFQDPKDPNMANCLVLLSNGTLKPLAVVLMESSGDGIRDLHGYDIEPIRVRDQSIEFQGKGKFECKACNKVFTSHQALGGHRASHKKVKGCFAANVVASNLENDEIDSEPTLEVEKITPDERVLAPKKSNKSHECSICHKVFPSGQALGGHKRCHWLPYTIPPPPPPQTTNITSSQQPLKFHNFLNVDESRPLNTCSNKKPRYTVISTPPQPNPYSSVSPKLGISLDISGGINVSGSTVTFLGPMSKSMKPSSNFFQSLHCSYKCKTTLSLFNDEDLIPSKMQGEGKSSSWLHLGITSSTSSEETA